MIVIIDYGMGNVGSIKNMIKKVGHDSVISSEPSCIQQATKLVLPGVGAFDNGMKNLHASGLIDLLNTKVLEEKVPILGICLGMQLMTKGSEEGCEQGLSWVDAQTLKFQSEQLKVPHMGWNVIQHKKPSKLFDELDSEKRFYFVHSYYVKAANEDDISCTTPYGHDFVSAFEHDNIIGCQFHPEKSHTFGMQLFKRFLEQY